MNKFAVRYCVISEKAQPQTVGSSPAVPRPHVRTTWNGPVIAVSLFGCALSITLLVLSLVFGDGTSFVVSVLLSTLSTLVGVTNHWQFELPVRKGLRTMF